jgi:hypothetical protein
MYTTVFVVALITLRDRGFGLKRKINSTEFHTPPPPTPPPPPPPQHIINNPKIAFLHYCPLFSHSHRECKQRLMQIMFNSEHE